MQPQVVLTSGAGKAYQGVAESAAIAVQDATDMLRNISTIATSAIGTAMARMLAGEPGAEPALVAAQGLIAQATKDYAAICAAAAAALREFPSG
jgi:hypothetical protein